MSFLELPDEIVSLIFSKCRSIDVLALGCTCVRFNQIANDLMLWQKLCSKEIESSGLYMPPCAREKEEKMTVDAIKRRLRRLRRILPRTVACKKCNGLTCQQGSFCHEERVVLDVGSKTTWCLSPNNIWQNHPSIYIGDQYGNCLSCEYARKLKPRPLFYSNFDTTTKPTYHQQHPNAKHHEPQTVISAFSDSRVKNLSVFDDSYNVIKRMNPDCFLRHPLECLESNLENDEGCKVFEEFLMHVLCKCRVFPYIGEANSSIVFCEPHFMNAKQRKKLCQFFFDVTAVGRVCFVNKAYSAAALTHIDTCLVVDSGCHNTVVSVMINGQIQPERTRHCPFGGQLISKHLTDCLRVRMNDCRFSCEGLDNHQVKLSCYLSHDIDSESNTFDETFKQCFVQCQRNGTLSHEWIEFGSELYTASELMYTTMQLPNMIVDALKGLPSSLVHQLVTRIIVTGANTELSGFRRRVVSDLRKLLPDCAHLNMHTYSGSRSWESCMGGTCLPVANTIDPMTLFCVQPCVPNTYQWISREEFILYGEDFVR